MFSSIQIHNIGPISDLSIKDIEALRSPIIIMGDNGVGKSTILDCFAFALTGDFPSKVGSIYNRVKHGQTEGSVRVVLHIHDDEYEIIRQIDTTKHKQKVFIYLNGFEVAGPTVNAAEKFISENIVSNDTMLMTNFSSQFKRGDFTAVDPSERKRILSDMLGLRFNELLPEFQQEKRETDKKCDSLVTQLSTIKTNTEDILPVNELASLQDAITKHDAKLSVIQEEKTILETTKQQLALDIEGFNQLLIKAKELKQTIDANLQLVEEECPNPQDIDRVIEGLLVRIDNISSKQKEAVLIRDNLKKQLIQTQSNIEHDKVLADTLEFVPCGNSYPTCPLLQSSFAAKERLSQHSDIETQQIKDKIDKLEEAVKKGEGLTTELNANLNKANKTKIMVKTHPQILNIGEVEKNFNEILPLINSNRRDKLQILKEDTYSRFNELVQSERILLEQKATLMENRGHILAQQEAQEKAAKLTEELETNLQFLSNEQKVLDLIVEGFGVKGIQPLILELSIPEICNIANDLLNMVSEGQFYIMLKTIKETLAKTVRETMLIEVTDSNGRVGDITEFSGGEQLMIMTCLRAALIIFNLRRGAGLPFLLSDEPFSAYDSDHNRKAIQMFGYLSTIIPQVVLISHQTETYVDAGTSILLTKIDGNITTNVVV